MDRELINKCILEAINPINNGSTQGHFRLIYINQKLTEFGISNPDLLRNELEHMVKDELLDKPRIGDPELYCVTDKWLDAARNKMGNLN